MSGFTKGLKLLFSKAEEPPLSTGSSKRDDLVGMIRRWTFYLFYCEKELIEILFRYLSPLGTGWNVSLVLVRGIFKLLGVGPLLHGVRI